MMDLSSLTTLRLTMIGVALSLVGAALWAVGWAHMRGEQLRQCGEAALGHCAECYAGPAMIAAGLSCVLFAAALRPSPALEAQGATR